MVQSASYLNGGGFFANTGIAKVAKEKKRAGLTYDNFIQARKNLELTVVRDGEYEVKTDSIAVDSEKSNDALKTVKEMVEDIQDVFGLTAAQVARAVGVSRPSLYNHIAEKNMRNISAYQQVYDLAVEVREKVQIDLKPGLKSVLVGGKTLLQYVTNFEHYQKDEIVQAALKVAEHLKVRSESATDHISETEQRYKIGAVSRPE